MAGSASNSPSEGAQPEIAVVGLLTVSHRKRTV